VPGDPVVRREQGAKEHGRLAAQIGGADEIEIVRKLVDPPHLPPDPPSLDLDEGAADATREPRTSVGERKTSVDPAGQRAAA